MKIDSSISSLHDLNIAQQIASMESFGSMDSVMGAIRRLPSIVMGAQKLYAAHLGNPAVPQFRSKELIDTYHKVEPFSYIDLRTMDVQVPEGLTVDFLSYVRALKVAGHLVKTIESDVLQPFDHWLAQVVGRPEMLSNLNHTLRVDGMKHLNFDAVNKTITNMFVQKGERHHLVPYGQAFQRNLDIKTLGTELDELEMLFGRDAQKRILAHVKRITELLQELMTILEGRQSELKVSSATVRAISEAAYEVARVLEQYGVFRYRLLELGHAVGETEKKIASWTLLRKKGHPK